MRRSDPKTLSLLGLVPFLQPPPAAGDMRELAAEGGGGREGGRERWAIPWGDRHLPLGIHFREHHVTGFTSNRPVSCIDSTTGVILGTKK